MSLHSSTEPSLYLLVKNIIVNHISRSQSYKQQWLTFNCQHSYQQ